MSEVILDSHDISWKASWVNKNLGSLGVPQNDSTCVQSSFTFQVGFAKATCLSWDFYTIIVINPRTKLIAHICVFRPLLEPYAAIKYDSDYDCCPKTMNSYSHKRIHSIMYMAEFARHNKIQTSFFVQNCPALAGNMIPRPVAAFCTPLEASSGHIWQKSNFGCSHFEEL